MLIHASLLLRYFLLGCNLLGNSRSLLLEPFLLDNCLLGNFLLGNSLHRLLLLPLLDVVSWQKLHRRRPT